MAVVQLKDVRVERVHSRGNGVTVLEQSGKFKTYWAVFFEEPSGLQVGDTVSLSGFLSVKVSDKTREDGTPFLDYALNKPRIQGAEPRAVPVSTDSYDPSNPSPWAVDDSAPF
ncbi:hypothetical protein [Gryllotalpicola koreensis]|uniref:Single-stranded DNA-binding protein n=1 Tax=Gryllotalpicola koreensis TaxID=993086 RepID=A0ABP8A1Z2_9MICO